MRPKGSVDMYKARSGEAGKGREMQWGETETTGGTFQQNDSCEQAVLQGRVVTSLW